MLRNLLAFVLLAVIVVSVLSEDFDGERYRRQYGGYGGGRRGFGGGGYGGYGGGRGGYGGGGYGGGFGGGGFGGGGYGGGYGR